jgi:hypothetical protein
VVSAPATYERLPREAIAARTRPRAVLAAFALEAIVAWLLAAPWSELVYAVWGHHPDGDRALWWQPGLTDAADFLVRQRAAVQAILASTAWGLAVWFLVSIVLLGALGTALATSIRTLGACLARGVSLFPRLAWLQVFSLFVQGVTFGALFVFPVALATSGDVRPTVEVSTLAMASLVFGAASLWLSSLVDLARALAIRWDLGAGRALLLAIRAPAVVGRLSLQVAPRWIASFGVIGLGAANSSASRSVSEIALAHLLIVLARVALRASIVARALRASDDAFEDEPALDSAPAPTPDARPAAPSPEAP